MTAAPTASAGPAPATVDPTSPAPSSSPGPSPSRGANRAAAEVSPADGPDPTPADPCVPGEPGGFSTSAAATHDWGTPNRGSDFTGTIDGGWGLYNGPGHVGNGRRSPSAASVQDGVLTITGDSKGTTAGMAWGTGQKYGRWEARVKSPAGDRSYHPVMLLWPDAENWPVGGEVDFMEVSAADRQSVDMFLHYGKNNSQVSGSIDIDATQWHNWAVEWTPKGITAYVDGKEWWKTTNTSILPPGPMHMTIQLDWFPQGGSVQTSKMFVDWTRQYPYVP